MSNQNLSSFWQAIDNAEPYFDERKDAEDAMIEKFDQYLTSEHIINLIKSRVKLCINKEIGNFDDRAEISIDAKDSIESALAEIISATVSKILNDQINERYEQKIEERGFYYFPSS